jgi:hypothetical protein
MSGNFTLFLIIRIVDLKRCEAGWIWVLGECTVSLQICKNMFTKLYFSVIILTDNKCTS